MLADVPATSLYGQLVAWDHLPAGLAQDVQRFQWDWATVKFDWALEQSVPWLSADVAAAGTVHLADSIDELTRCCADLSTHMVPARPFVLLGQLSDPADPTRSPAGTESLYGYTHVPCRVVGDAGDGSVKGVWDPADLEALADRVEGRIEQHAPGFRSQIKARHLLGPGGLEEHDGNLVGGAIIGGTSGLHQQLIFRPVPGSAARNAAPGVVPGVVLSSSRWRRARRLRGECGPGGPDGPAALPTTRRHAGAARLAARHHAATLAFGLTTSGRYAARSSGLIAYVWSFSIRSRWGEGKSEDMPE